MKRLPPEIEHFSDLALLGRSTLEALVRRVPADQLALALVGADEATRRAFLSILSEPAATALLRDAIGQLGKSEAPPGAEIDVAQGAIVERAKMVIEEEFLAAGAAP